MKKLNFYILLLFIIDVLVASWFLYEIFSLNTFNLEAFIFFIVFSCFSYGYYIKNRTFYNDVRKNIESNIETNLKESFDLYSIGVLYFDTKLNITWYSKLFEERKLCKPKQNVCVLFPSLTKLFEGEVSSVELEIDDMHYEVYLNDKKNALYFKDISQVKTLNNKLFQNQVVIGVIHFDNYDESIMPDEDILEFNTYIRSEVINYLNLHKIDFKTLKNNRIFLLLYKKRYLELVQDKFSILNTIRHISEQRQLDITLSMAFTFGDANFQQLDKTLIDLIDIAIARGGDQVVIHESNKEIEFFGGKSEAIRKLNGTKAKTISKTIASLINSSSNIMICLHNDADADCISSALCFSLISLALNKKAYIISKSVTIEKTIENVLKQYNEVLIQKHQFISLQEAKQLLDENTLAVMVDHNDIEQSSSKDLLFDSKKVIIIDHHRRKANMIIEPILTCIEAGASSTIEIMVDLIEHFTKKVDINKYEANIMYLGLLIDTNNFKMRSDEKTFSIAKTISKYGANTNACLKMLYDDYTDVLDKSHIISHSKIYKDNILISKMEEDRIYSRTIASKCADEMLECQNIEATFVIYKSIDNSTMISARSINDINVQTILETLGGGGHMHAAGLKKNDKIEEVYNQLLLSIDSYFDTNKEVV